MKHIFIYFLLLFINVMGMEKTDAECLLLYKAHIARSLPRDICNYIDHVYTQLTNSKRKENFISTHKGHWQCAYNQEKHHSLMISHDGHYYTYNFSDNPKLIYTETGCIKMIDTGYKSPIHFSPNNRYCIIKDYNETYLYNLINKTKLTLIEKEKTTCFGITVSNDSQHILFEGRHKIQRSKPTYLLWSIDEQETLKTIPLKDDLLYTVSAIFHPDNKHIIRNQSCDELLLYNIATTQDIIISPRRDENVFWINELTITPDNKTILGTTQPKEINAQPDYILFNIENIDQVTSITLTPQSCHEKAKLPVLAIPHKQLLTHLTNEGRTLQLIDHNQEQIAIHHALQNSYITALTVSTTGNYLAVGHSDGTIAIWNICSTNPMHFQKTYVKSNGSIISLTLTNNQLLLSQSKINRCWNAAEESKKIGGDAILWDVYGNEIINFGDNVINSIISPNGKTINIAHTTFAKNVIGQYVSTLVTYHQTDEMLSLCNIKELSLTQLYDLIHATTIHLHQKLLDEQ